MAQLDTADEIGDSFAQTKLEDENLSAVAEYLAQLEEEDLNKIGDQLAQLSEQDYDEMYAQVGEQDDEMLNAQVGAEVEAKADDMLPKVAQFLAQLGEGDIDSMELYLLQLEHASESGDSATLAQLGSTIDENM